MKITDDFLLDKIIKQCEGYSDKKINRLIMENK